MSWEYAAPFITMELRNGLDRVGGFEVRVDGGMDGDRMFWMYLVRPLGGAVTDGHDYLMTVLSIKPGLWQVDGVVNRLPSDFRGFGITRALIPKVAERLGATVQSSRHRPSEGETRTAEATKVWESLRADGAVVYDSQDDRYRYIWPRAEAQRT